MRIIRDTLHTQIGGDCSEKELNDILKLLTFKRKNGDLTHITEDGGFYTGLISLLEERGMEFDIEDVAPTPKVPLRDIEVDPYILENRVLRKYQIAAVRKALAFGRGVIQSPTGCFAGFTKVRLLDGSTHTLAELEQEGGSYYFYSRLTDGSMVPGGPSRVVKTKSKVSMVKVTLDDGYFEVCTSDHLWIMKSGLEMRADQLISGTSLAPLYTRNLKGYEQIRVYDKSDRGRWHYTHHLVLKNSPASDYERHHKNEIKTDNRPTNLEWKEFYDHLDTHFKNRHNSVQLEKAKDKCIKWNKSPEGRLAASGPNPSKATYQYGEFNTSWRNDITWDNLVSAAPLCGSREELEEALGCSGSLIYKVLKENGVFYKDFKRTCMLRREYSDCGFKRNHTVVSVEHWPFPEDAYDVVNCGPVHNFALASGVYVHNSGKTEMAAASIAHFQRRGTVDTTFVLCPTVFLMQQMANKFEEFGFDKIGRIGGGKRFKQGCKTAIYVVDSAINDLDKGGPSAEFLMNADMMGLEEAHHAKATRWTDVAHAARAKIRLAFTATVHENPTQWSYEDLVLLGVTGPIIFNVRSKELRLLGYLADPLVTTLRVRWKISGFDWHRVYKQGIVLNNRRNSMIISIATSTYEAGFKSMIFVGEKKHGHLLAESCAKMGCEAVFVHGGGRSWIYHPSGARDFNYWNVEDIAEYVNSRDQCILVSTCLSGSTKVSLLNGTEVPIKDLQGKDPFYIYSYDKLSGKIVPGLAHSVRLTGKQVNTLKVTLDNGETVVCTPDHPWMLRDGSYLQAKNLTPGTSLMPLYRSEDSKGYETLLDPSSDEYFKTHQVSAKWFYGDDVYKFTKGRTVIHHRDFNKRNNDPNNLIPLEFLEHIKLHGDNINNLRTHEFERRRLEGSSSYHRSEEGRRSASEKFKYLWTHDTDFILKMYEREFTDSQRKTCSRNLREYNYSTSKVGSDNPRYIHHIDLESILPLMEDLGITISDVAHVLSCSSKVLRNRLRSGLDLGWLETMRMIHGPRYYHNGKGTNHKVSSIERGPLEDVYDLTVEGTHNFALTAGVFVHNCVLDEGLDVPVINVLIMGTGMKKYRRTIQRIGRGMRPKKGQNRVFVFDFWDESHDMLLTHSEYRRWTYNTEEYDFAEDLKETQEVMGCKISLNQNLFKTVLKHQF